MLPCAARAVPAGRVPLASTIRASTLRRAAIGAITERSTSRAHSHDRCTPSTPCGTAGVVGHREGDVDEAPWLGLLRQELGQQHGLVDVAGVLALQRILEPRTLGDVGAFQQALGRDLHLAVQAGHADPAVVAVAVLHLVERLAAPFERRFRTQAAALGDQAHLAVAFVHAALELVGGLHRQLGQAVADAGLDLLGVAALDHGDQQHVSTTDSRVKASASQAPRRRGSRNAGNGREDGIAGREKRPPPA